MSAISACAAGHFRFYFRQKSSHAAVVGGNDERRAMVSGGALQQGQRRQCGLVVQAGRGFIGQDDLGPEQHRPRQRNPLGLAVRELRRFAAGQRLHAQGRQRLGDARIVLRLAGRSLRHGEIAHQVVVLD